MSLRRRFLPAVEVELAETKRKNYKVRENFRETSRRNDNVEQKTIFHYRIHLNDYNYFVRGGVLTRQNVLRIFRSPPPAE